MERIDKQTRAVKYSNIGMYDSKLAMMTREKRKPRQRVRLTRRVYWTNY
jgi:hypothetical protein